VFRPALPVPPPSNGGGGSPPPPPAPPPHDPGHGHGGHDHARPHGGHGSQTVAEWTDDGASSTGWTSSGGDAPAPADAFDNGVPAAAAATNLPPCPDPEALRQEMQQVADRTRAELESSPQWARNRADVRIALGDVDVAQAHLNALLAQRPAYQAALADVNDAEAVLAALRARDGAAASPAEVTVLAQARLDAAGRLEQVRRAALATDPQLARLADELAAARARLTGAGSAREMLQRRSAADLLNDPQWQAARQQLNGMP
jgi:hypothetical protein